MTDFAPQIIVCLIIAAICLANGLHVLMNRDQSDE